MAQTYELLHLEDMSVRSFRTEDEALGQVYGAASRGDRGVDKLVLSRTSDSGTSRTIAEGGTLVDRAMRRFAPVSRSA